MKLSALLSTFALLLLASGCGSVDPPKAAHQPPVFADPIDMTYALRTRNWEAVKKLVRLRPSLVDHGYRGQNSPLFLAARLGRADVLKVLLEHQADPNPWANGQTPLMAAVYAHHFEGVKVLIEAGVPLKASEDGKYRPLQWAVSEGDRRTMEFFLKKGAKADLPGRDYQLLHGLAEAEPGDPEKMALLIQYGADVNAKNPVGRTPLHFAASSPRTPKTELLLSRKADPNVHDESGTTPLHVAAAVGRLEVVKMLLDHGALVDAKDNHKRAALVIAVRRGRLDLVRLLLEKGADPNLVDRTGDAPLHWAVRRGGLEMVRLLLKKGAKPLLRSTNDKTPLDLAEDKGMKEIADLLRAQAE